MQKYEKCKYAAGGSVKTKIKKLLSFCFYLFILFRKPKRPVGDPSKNTIAVIMLASIGDLIVFCDAAKKITANGKEIILICKKGNGTADFAKKAGLFDRIVEINFNGFHRLFGIKALRRIEADTVFCAPLGRHALSDTCVCAVRAKHRILPDTLLDCSLPIIKRIFDKRADELIPISEVSEIKRYTEFFNACGLIFEKVKVFKSDCSDTHRNRTLAIFPGAGGGNGKCWQTEKFSFTAKGIIKKGFISKVLILGNNSDTDRCDTLYSLLCKCCDTVNLCGKTTISELADILTECCLTLTNDSGGAHLSIACDTPTIIICGMWQPGRFYPNSELSRSHSAVFAGECFLQTCDSSYPLCLNKTAPCIDAVNPNTVLKHAEEILRLS